jgi:hypothetical protein
MQKLQSGIIIFLIPSEIEELHRILFELSGEDYFDGAYVCWKSAFSAG